MRDKQTYRSARRNAVREEREVWTEDDRLDGSGYGVKERPKAMKPIGRLTRRRKAA